MSNLRTFPVRQLRLQQRLDRPTLVHRAVALGDLRQRQYQVEHLSRIDGPVEDEIDQLRQILANRRGATVQMDMREEQLLPIERHTVWHTDVAHVAAWPVALMACIIDS